MEASQRISVLRGSHLVPLLASVGTCSREPQPWKDVLLEKHIVVSGEIDQHEHPDLCLHLQTKGAEDFEWWSDGRNAVEHTHPGSLILIPPGTRDRLRWQGTSERIILSLPAKSFTDTAEELGVTHSPEFNIRWALDDPMLRRIVVEMGEQAMSSWPLGSLYGDLLALTLKKQLLRTHAMVPLDLPILSGGIPLPKLRRALEYMNSNLAEDVRLEAIAAELRMGSSHFAHSFRAATGRTPYQHLLDRRMAEAKHLLKSTKLSVQDIGERVGFRSPVNFVRAFRQRLAVTPEAWRHGA